MAYRSRLRPVLRTRSRCHSSYHTLKIAVNYHKNKRTEKQKLNAQHLFKLLQFY